MYFERWMILKYKRVCVFVIIAVECNDSVYTERSGEITSPDFPKPYPKSSDCTYHIELEEGFQITLEFDDTFDIEDHPEVTCPYDFIKVSENRVRTCLVFVPLTASFIAKNVLLI